MKKESDILEALSEVLADVQGKEPLRERTVNIASVQHNRRAYVTQVVIPAKAGTQRNVKKNDHLI